MILLLGGTGDTAAVAAELVRGGYHVLVSRATPIPLDIGDHPQIESRIGPLDETELATLIQSRAVRAIVDAAHPYATTIHALARRVAMAKGIPCLRLMRAAAVVAETPGVEFAEDHASAAAMAFVLGRPVLSTIGVRNLAIYAAQSQRTGIPLVVRILNQASSIETCRSLGIPEDRVIVGRGPYGIEENRLQIRDHKIGVLVTKDGGEAGGTPEKLAAAEAEGCRVIVVRRPADHADETFSDAAELLAAIRRQGV